MIVPFIAGVILIVLGALALVIVLRGLSNVQRNLVIRLGFQKPLRLRLESRMIIAGWASVFIAGVGLAVLFHP